jgi:hypothetical protein
MSFFKSRSQIVGPATVSAPASGVISLTINGAGGTFVTQLVSLNGTTGNADQYINRNGSLANTVGAGPSIQLFDTNNAVGTMVQHSGGQTELWQYNAGWNQILKVTSNRDWVARGVSVCLRATAIEQRTSTTTLTNSTQLTYPVPAAGTYAFEALVFSYFTTALTDGITANINYSGTFTTPGSYVTGFLMNGTTTTLGIQPVGISATVNNALAGMTLATYGASVTSAAPACHVLKGNLIATGAGTLAFAFAEAVNGIDSANLGVGSYMTVTQLS